MNSFYFALIYFAKFLMLDAQFGFDYDTASPEEYTSDMKDANNLYNELFTKRNYNRYLFPFNGKTRVNGTDNKLQVHFDLFYIKLVSLDAESQLLSVNLELKMYWRDPRLTWDPTSFNGTDHLFVSTEIMWIPDCQIGNAKLKVLNRFNTSKTLDSVKAGEAVRSVEISSNGTVYLPVFYYTEVACPIIINTFPFDRQLCPIPIMSLAFDVRYISMSVGIDPFLFQMQQMQVAESIARSAQNLSIKNLPFSSTTDGLVGVLFSKQFLAWGNGEWDVMNISSLSASQGGMEILCYLLSIRRVPNFYVYVIATPCFILTTLSIVGMFWTPNIKKEQLVKLTIGLTSLVSMTVLLDMLSSAIPKTAVFPLLGIYVVCCVGITSFASVVITLHCLPNPKKHQNHQQDEKSPEKETVKPSHASTVIRFIESILHRNYFLLIFFQLLNLIGFIVFLSFWD